MLRISIHESQTTLWVGLFGEKKTTRQASLPNLASNDKKNPNSLHIEWKKNRLYSWDYVVQLYTWTENWVNWTRQQNLLVSKHKECKNFQKVSQPDFFGKELKSFKAKQENTKRREIKIFHPFLAEMEIFAQVQWTGDFYRYNRQETISLLNNASITGALEPTCCLNIVALPSQKHLFWGDGDV